MWIRFPPQALKGGEHMKEPLKIVKDQLVQMEKYLSDLGTEESLAAWGELPGFPDKYIPALWNEENRPVHVIWEDYLDRSWDEPDIQVADLLAWSEAGVVRWLTQ